MTVRIAIANYLYIELDNRRRVLDPETGEKETWTEFLCRCFSIKYRRHGVLGLNVRTTTGTVGRPPRGKG